MKKENRYCEYHKDRDIVVECVAKCGRSICYECRRRFYGLCYDCAKIKVEQATKAVIGNIFAPLIYAPLLSVLVGTIISIVANKLDTLIWLGLCFSGIPILGVEGLVKRNIIKTATKDNFDFFEKYSLWDVGLLVFYIYACLFMFYAAIIILVCFGTYGIIYAIKLLSKYKNYKYQFTLYKQYIMSGGKPLGVIEERDELFDRRKEDLLRRKVDDPNDIYKSRME